MSYTVEHHAIIDATPDAVWAIVRDFANVARWNPVAETSRLVAGENGKTGAERELSLAGGGTVRERLVRLDDANRVLVYRMVTFPIPVTAQENTIRVDPANDDMRTEITFTATFTPAPGHDEAEIREINLGAFAGAVTTLRGILT